MATDEMTYALDKLKISQDEFSLFDTYSLRKRYLREALKVHPDKGGSNLQFQELNDAYDTLSHYISIETTAKSYDNCQDDPTGIFNDKFFQDLKTSFLFDINNWQNAKEHYMEYLNSILNNILNVFDPATLIHMKPFIDKIKTLLREGGSVPERSDRMSDKNSCKHIVIRPKLADVFEEKIFLLDGYEKQLYVPLWHNELVYDISGEELVVQCIPNTPPDIWIDEDNNIHKQFSISFNIELLRPGFKHVVHVFNRSVEINTNNLLCKKIQLVRFPNKGILKINTKDIFDANTYSDLIVHVHLL